MDRAESYCALLEREAEQCAALNGLLGEEARAIARGSPEDLMAVLRCKEVVHHALVDLQRQRREVAAHLISEGGSSGLSRAVEVAARLPEPWGSRARAAAERLCGEITEARRQQRRNQTLVQRSLEVVGDLLAAFQSRMPGVRYDGRAAMLAPGGSRGALDRRI